MKKILLLLFTFVFVAGGFAQPRKGYVYLKNGTVLKGRYQYTGDSTKLKMESTGNLWIFEAGEVERVADKQSRKNEIFEYRASSSPLFVHTEMGFLAGSAENSQSAPFSLTAALNYAINTQIAAGAGVGFEFFNETYMPLFANVEYKFRNSYSSPYAFMKLGYQIPLENADGLYYNGYEPWRNNIWPGPTYVNQNSDTRGGLLINPGLGYQHLFSPNFGMSFALGYQFHRLKYKGENGYRLDIDYNRLTIKLGFIFN